MHDSPQKGATEKSDFRRSRYRQSAYGQSILNVKLIFYKSAERKNFNEIKKYEGKYCVRNKGE
jgi:hypothetical protein